MPAPSESTLVQRIRAQGAPSQPAALLDLALAEFNCPAGSIHRWDPDTTQLILLASRGLPDAILPTISRIPLGKGMAGLAAQRREPVSICNLQTDTSGQAKPGARRTGMEGSIAVPMLVDDELRGVLGIAKPTPYDFSPSEKELLLQAATEIGRRISITHEI